MRNNKSRPFLFECGYILLNISSIKYNNISHVHLDHHLHHPSLVLLPAPTMHVNLLYNPNELIQDFLSRRTLSLLLLLFLPHSPHKLQHIIIVYILVADESNPL